MYTSLVEVCNDATGGAYSLREIWVNSKHVVHFKEDVEMQRALTDGLLPDDLNEHQTFTRIYVACGSQFFSTSVVGGPMLIWEKLDAS